MTQAALVISDAAARRERRKREVGAMLSSFWLLVLNALLVVVIRPRQTVSLLQYQLCHQHRHNLCPHVLQLISSKKRSKKSLTVPLSSLSTKSGVDYLRRPSFSRGDFDGGTVVASRPTAIRNRGGGMRLQHFIPFLTPASWTSLFVSTAVDPLDGNASDGSQSDSNLCDTVMGRTRTCLRRATGVSLTGLRSTMRAATGFSLTSVRATLRAATGVSISGAVKTTLDVFPIWARFLFQPFLIAYYWPLFVVRGVVGFDKTYKSDASDAHEAFLDGWRRAVEVARIANGDGYWPIKVTDTGGFQFVLPPDADGILSGEFMEFVSDEHLPLLLQPPLSHVEDIVMAVEDSIAEATSIAAGEDEDEYDDELGNDDERMAASMVGTKNLDGVPMLRQLRNMPTEILTDDTSGVVMKNTNMASNFVVAYESTRDSQADATSATVAVPTDTVPKTGAEVAIDGHVFAAASNVPTDESPVSHETKTVVDEVTISAVTQSVTMGGTATDMPEGPRWAIASPTTDLSGKWYVLNTEEFRAEYDAYLQSLGQPAIVRAVASSIIGMTREETTQQEDGRKLVIRGANPRGVWERTLLSSGADVGKSTFQPVHTSLVTADSEHVNAESWWANGGTVHTSWMRGGNKYGGGDFESCRYLESENVLVCRSVFHPRDDKRETSSVTWRFQREGTQEERHQG